jgi:hypothetical protein
MRTVLSLLGVWLLLSSFAAAREWTDDTGAYHAEARLLGRDGDTIWLARSDGKTVKVALDRLSAADRTFVEETLALEPLVPKVPQMNPAAISVTEPRQKVIRSFRFASASVTQVAQESSEAEAADLPGSKHKYLYRGCDFDAQIIVFKGPPVGIGTVAYWREWHHRLDGLEFFFEDNSHFHCKVIFHGDGYKFWSFGRIPNCCGCYPVWAWDFVMRPHFKGWHYREKVW